MGAVQPTPHFGQKCGAGAALAAAVDASFLSAMGISLGPSSSSPAVSRRRLWVGGGSSSSDAAPDIPPTEARARERRALSLLRADPADQTRNLPLLRSVVIAFCNELRCERALKCRMRQRQLTCPRSGGSGRCSCLFHFRVAHEVGLVPLAVHRPVIIICFLTCASFSSFSSAASLPSLMRAVDSASEMTCPDGTSRSSLSPSSPRMEREAARCGRRRVCDRR